MKKALAFLFPVVLMLCACSNGQNTDADKTVDNLIEAVSEDEKEKIIELIEDCGEFCYLYIDCKGVIDCTSSNPSDKYTDSDGNEWLLINSGDITTKEQLDDKLSSLISDNVEDISADTLYLSVDEKLYLSKNAGMNGGLLGYDKLIYNAAIWVDSETVAVHMTAYGAKENWEAPEDNTDDFTITLKKSGDSFVIDEMDAGERSYITWLRNRIVS